MSLNVEVKTPYLKNLVCAYTGKPAGVRMVSRGSEAPVYFAANAYDPAAIHETAAELLERLGTRNGITGVLQGSAALVCPYTGNRLTIQKVEGLGFRATGGFSPSLPTKDPIAFARAMNMRGGAEPAGKEIKPVSILAAVVPEPPEEIVAPAVSENDAGAMAEDILKDTADLRAKTSVTVPAGAPRGKKAKSQR